MTNDERNPKPECPNALSLCAVAGFVIRISSFLRISSFVIRHSTSKPPNRGRGRERRRCGGWWRVASSGPVRIRDAPRTCRGAGRWLLPNERAGRKAPTRNGEWVAFPIGRVAKSRTGLWKRAQIRGKTRKRWSGPNSACPKLGWAAQYVGPNQIREIPLAEFSVCHLDLLVSRPDQAGEIGARVFGRLAAHNQFRIRRLDGVVDPTESCALDLLQVWSIRVG